MLIISVITLLQYQSSRQGEYTDCLHPRMDLQRKACLAIILALGTKRRVKRRCWMKEWLKKRNKYSHVVLLKEISATEVDDYKNYFRMNEETFNKLRHMIEPFFKQERHLCGVVCR
jgi:hypothetical protein